MVDDNYTVEIVVVVDQTCAVDHRTVVAVVWSVFVVDTVELEAVVEHYEENIDVVVVMDMDDLDDIDDQAVVCIVLVILQEILQHKIRKID